VVVLAAGVWSRSIAGLAPELRPPVRPIKGQMPALGMDPAAPLLTLGAGRLSGALYFSITSINDGKLLDFFSAIASRSASEALTTPSRLWESICDRVEITLGHRLTYGAGSC
jgi:glycine/D-amino acid oxidase-like deaminating enzyme